MIEISENKDLLKISLNKKNVKNLKTLNQKIYENEELLVTSENIYKLINCFDKNFFLNRQDKLLIPIALKNRKNFFNITKEDDNLSFSKTHSIKSLTKPYFLKNIFLLNLIFKDYQKYGISWLKKENSRLLADDMGLGKTLQSIAAAAELIVEGKINRALIICPNSLVFNWSSEIIKWLPSFCVTQVSDTKSGNSRDITWEKIYKNTHFIVTSYDQVRSTPKVLKKESIDLIILDEAHKLRKSSSKINKSIMSMNPKRVWALTGTPIENNIDDLKNLLSIIDRKVNKLSFKNYSDSFISYETKKYILRRMKSDVLNEMKEFYEKTYYLDLTYDQQTEYEGILKKFYKSNMEDKLKYFGELKQLCDIDTKTLQSSKIDFAEDIIEKVWKNQEKCVVFSFWLPPLDELAKRLKTSYGSNFFQEFNGSIEKDKREEILTKFKTDPQCRVILCSGKIAGEGLNLTEANHVIFLNSWWNPSNNIQARDRVIRIGQTKEAYVYYLRSANTIEARVDEILDRKEDITDEVIDSLIFESSRLISKNGKI